MATCLKCNTYNNAGNLYCKKCEAILPVEGENRCPKCKASNGPFAKACKECGEQFARIGGQLGHSHTSKNSANSNLTNLNTYKKKKAVKQLRSTVKSKRLGPKVIYSVLALLFIIGVVATIL